MYVQDPDRFIVRSKAELLRLADSGSAPVQPYADPALTESPAMTRELVTRLHSVGLIGFRLRVRSFIGLFAVGKKDGSQRLIIDARSANDLHRRVPYAPLASSSAVSEVLLNAAGPAGEGDTAIPHGTSIDFQDGFYQFLFWQIAVWFGIRMPVQAGDFNVSSVYDDTQQWVDVATDTWL